MHAAHQLDVFSKLCLNPAERHAGCPYRSGQGPNPTRGFQNYRAWLQPLSSAPALHLWILLLHTMCRLDPSDQDNRNRHSAIKCLPSYGRGLQQIRATNIFLQMCGLIHRRPNQRVLPAIPPLKYGLPARQHGLRRLD